MRHGLLETVECLTIINFKPVSGNRLLRQQETCPCMVCRTETLIRCEVKNATGHLKWMTKAIPQFGQVV